MIASIAPSPSITRGLAAIPVAGEPAGRVAAPGVRAAAESGGESLAQVPRRARQAAGDPQPAPASSRKSVTPAATSGWAPGQQSLRPWRLSPRGIRMGRGPAWQGDQGVGGAPLSATSVTRASLGQRAIQLALRKLRRWVRKGAPRSWILTTPSSAARQGWLDVKLRPERHNGVKLLVFFDVGAPWMPTWPRCSSSSRPCATSSNTWCSSTSTTVSTTSSGGTTPAVSRSVSTPQRLLRTYGSDYRVILWGCEDGTL